MPSYPIGQSDFKTILEEGQVFIDKSLLIKELIDDGTQIPLLLRPRRFGKSLNLSMLNCFFSSKFRGCANLFEKLSIGRVDNGRYMQHQGKYTVIHFTLKDVKPTSYNEAYQQLKRLIRDIYSEYDYLLASPYLKNIQKQDFEKVLNGTAEISLLKSSLKDLIRYLYQHHNAVDNPENARAKPIAEQQRIVLLIDEYDAPILAAHENRYYENMMEVMRDFIGSAIKDNVYIFKGILTGILRISQASLFSGANNIKAYSVLSNSYSKHFGFTQEEVVSLLKNAQLDNCVELVQKWYNGYQFGELTIYNPWSIMNYLSDVVGKGKGSNIFDSYWINTSSNTLIKKSLMHASIEVKEKFLDLLQGNSVECNVDEHSVFDNIEKESTALWGLLVFSGYLTVVKRLSPVNSSSTSACVLKLPNQEVRGLFDQLTQQELKKVCEGDTQYQAFIKSLSEGDTRVFSEIVERYLKESASAHDFPKDTAEVVYHTFILGMVVGLRGDYNIFSNRESGYGRYDVAFYPKEHRAVRRGIILEFKATQDSSSLPKEAQDALQQIQNRQYYVDMQAHHGVEEVLLVGMAFCGKKVNIVSKLVKLVNRPVKKPLFPLPGVKSNVPSAQTTAAVATDLKRKLSSESSLNIKKKAKLGQHAVEFEIHATKGDGNAGFYALPIAHDRQGARDLLLGKKNERHIRALVAPEIRAVILEGNGLEVFPSHDFYQQWRQEFFALEQKIDNAVRAASAATAHDKNKPLNNHLDGLIKFFANPANSTPFSANSYKKHLENLRKLHTDLENHEKKLSNNLIEMSGYFTDFVDHYIGGKSRLDFALNRAILQTSSLDAIAEIQHWRVHIWQTIDGENELKLMYVCGPENGQPQHIFYAEGLDAHFELMHVLDNPPEPGCSQNQKSAIRL